jgi:hypothetical protein
MTALSECSQWHAEQARVCASKASNLRGISCRLGLAFCAEADALELLSAKHRLWALSCAEADTDEPGVSSMEAAKHITLSRPMNGEWRQ